MFEIKFQYDKSRRLWEVLVAGAICETEALVGFHAVVITMRDVVPKFEYNRATKQESGEYKISVGV